MAIYFDVIVFDHKIGVIFLRIITFGQSKSKAKTNNFWYSPLQKPHNDRIRRKEHPSNSQTTNSPRVVLLSLSLSYVRKQQDFMPHFFLPVIFRVTHDGLGERKTISSIYLENFRRSKPWTNFGPMSSFKACTLKWMLSDPLFRHLTPEPSIFGNQSRGAVKTGRANGSLLSSNHFQTALQMLANAWL